MNRTKDDVFVYAEGGGEGALAAEMRQAFAEFFCKTALGAVRRPRVVPCGSRTDALASFTIAVGRGRNALLLVDSEVPVDPLDHGLPWVHLAKSDGWRRPESAADVDCHLMVQCMESWFLADWGAISGFFGQGFNARLKPVHPVESVATQDVYDLLAKATKACKAKNAYDKTSHSFKLLALISAEAVCAASPWAQRFIDELLTRKS